MADALKLFTTGSAATGQAEGVAAAGGALVLFKAMDALWTGHSACGECEWTEQAGQRRIADFVEMPRAASGQDGPLSRIGKSILNEKRPDVEHAPPSIRREKRHLIKQV